MEDHTRRGTELVIAELMGQLAKKCDWLQGIYRDRPSEFGSSRHTDFATEITCMSSELGKLMCSYIAAERILGRK